MNSLHNTTKIVKTILQEDEQARNSDSFLYLKVLDYYGQMNGIDIHMMSITTFLLKLREFGFPPSESVRRARQKIQAEHPELRACKRVEAVRAEQEKAYRAFTKEKVMNNGK